MNSYQTALKGQTEAYEAAQAALLAQQTEMDRLYAALARKIEQRAAQQRLDAAQRAAQQAESAYHDMLLSQNPLGLQAQRSAEQTQYAQTAAYNTFGADRAFVRDTEQAAETAIQAAESSGLASAAQHKAEQNAQTAKAMEKQMDAYAKARLALLKKAYKAQADTTGV